jgi:uncharacterized RDD family membrane protein YckC
MGELISQIINFIVMVLVTVVIWTYYADRVYAPRNRYATFWPRFWTGSVDACVLWPVSFLSAIISTLQLGPRMGVVVAILPQLAWLIYTVWMHAERGQSVGKIACRVRVVDNATEGPISLKQAVLREVIPILASFGIVGYELYLIWTRSLQPAAMAKVDMAEMRTLGVLAAVPALWFIAEIVTMLTNEKRRAFHDYIAGTSVVRTNLTGNA